MNDKTKRAVTELESPFLDGELLAGRPRPEASEEPGDMEDAAGEATLGEDVGVIEGERQVFAEAADNPEAEVSEECED